MYLEGEGCIQEDRGVSRGRGVYPGGEGCIQGERGVSRGRGVYQLFRLNEVYPGPGEKWGKGEMRSRVSKV